MWTIVALGFAVILGVPFAAGVGAMAVPLNRLARIGVACGPVVLLAVAIATGSFWLGDIGGAIIAFIATWAWLLGVGSSHDVRPLLRRVVSVPQI